MDLNVTLAQSRRPPASPGPRVKHMPVNGPGNSPDILLTWKPFTQMGKDWQCRKQVPRALQLKIVAVGPGYGQDRWPLAM